MTQVSNTPEARNIFMTALCNKLADTIGYLYARWQDERDYEDFTDYQNKIMDEIKGYNPDIQVESINKRFTVTLKVPGFPYKPKLVCSSKSFGWKS